MAATAQLRSELAASAGSGSGSSAGASTDAASGKLKAGTKVQLAEEGNTHGCLQPGDHGVVVRDDKDELPILVPPPRGRQRPFHCARGQQRLRAWRRASHMPPPLRPRHTRR